MRSAGNLNSGTASKMEGHFNSGNHKCCKLLKFILAYLYKAMSLIHWDFGAENVTVTHIGNITHIYLGEEILG